ncbi:MAG: hypothetical protein LBP51_06300 [Deferribacteraceae bacterium]|jgi:antitoxin component YwqK of YwqJK toxin-antitoxin module|nr:hypothetical protein [Deferribacteraceae bacterium]
MRNYYFIIFFVLISPLIFAQKAEHKEYIYGTDVYYNNDSKTYISKSDNKPITGLLRKYYDFPTNSKLHFEEYIIDGKEMEMIRMYSETGKAVFEKNYKNGKLNGWARNYYENGLIQTETFYKDDVYDGLSRIYFQNGVVFEIVYSNNTAVNLSCIEPTGKKLTFTKQEIKAFNNKAEITCHNAAIQRYGRLTIQKYNGVELMSF